MTTTIGKRILDPAEACLRLGNMSNSNFYEKFVGTGRVRLVNITPRRVGVLEDELDALIDELAAARGVAANRQSAERETTSKPKTKRKKATETATDAAI